MQVSVTDAGPLRKQVTITYDGSEVASREQELLTRYAGRMNMKGFRAGKVPPKLVKQRFGKAVTAEVREALGQEGLQRALEDHQLKPIGPISSDEPEEDAAVDAGFHLQVSFDVRPVIELPDPAAIEIPVEDPSASDQEVEEELETFRRRAGDHRELTEDETIARDDSVTLSGSITSGGETVRQVQDLNHLVGAYPLFGLEPEQVVEHFAGKKVGDEVAFSSTLPETFKPEEWANHEVDVAVTVQRAQRLEPAALDDELAKRLGTESLEQLRERVKDMIASRKGNELHQRQTEALVEELIAKTDFELPPQLRGNLVDQRLAQELQRAKQGGEGEVDADALKEEKRGEAEEAADRDLRRHLLMQAIADARNVQATQQDLQQQIQMAAYQSGRQPEELVKQLQESGRLQEVAMDIRMHKALEVFLQEVLAAKGGGEGASAEAAAGATAEAGGEREAEQS